jgi:hypothetical protein
MINIGEYLILKRIKKMERRIMATFDEVLAAATQALEMLRANNAKTDELIVKVGELIAAGGANPEQLEELRMLMVTAQDESTAQIGETETALNQ